MIYQEMPRKGYEGCNIAENKGFYVEGKDYADCLNQLKEWAEKHPEKWIYYHDCGIGISKSCPVTRQVFEVSFFDAEPAAMVLFSCLFQRGCEGKREIDSLSESEIAEIRRKQLDFFTILGSAIH